MLVTCDDCQRQYDDANQWTLCPHTPLGHAVYDLCPKCDTLLSLHGACEHQTVHADREAVCLGGPAHGVKVPLKRNMNRFFRHEVQVDRSSMDSTGETRDHYYNLYRANIGSGCDRRILHIYVHMQYKDYEHALEIFSTAFKVI